MKKNVALDPPRTPCWPQAQGNWVGAKGSAGYDLAGLDGSSDVSYMPGRHRYARQGQPLCVGAADNR